MLSKMDNNSDQEAGDSDQEAADPGQLLDDWLGELNILSEGLEVGNLQARNVQLNQEITTPRIDSYRFSMANLEDSPEVDLDAILGELCALGCDYEREIQRGQEARTNKRDSDKTNIGNNIQTMQQQRQKLEEETILLSKTADRTDSPDNDSAFSDTVSMLSSESSASSGASNTKPSTLLLLSDDASRAKAEKIRMAMEKIKEANIQKLFVKVFTMDGSAKSLLIDEKMTCAYVTRLLADKNHVSMDPKWALVEHLPDLLMERVLEDHELLVENLMLWTRDSKNKIYFVERPDKVMLFNQPERFLFTDRAGGKCSADNDEHSRNMLLEEFFSSHTGPAGGGIPEMEGPLYLKSDSKKGWKKYHFVLRASGLYYQKEKQKSIRDLVCLATFDVNQIYYGIGWKKKFKAPTDYCFAIKHPRLQEPKSTKYIKYLCAEDKQSLDRWMVGMRIAKVGKQVMENYRSLVEELAQEDLDLLAHARSCSVTSIPQSNASSATTPSSQGYAPSEGYATQSEISSGRHSRASSSSSSGCMSDGASSSCENAFDAEFPTGTIKRKPSMKPSIPLTNITRQLKQVGETCDEPDCAISPGAQSPVSFTNSGTLTRRHSRRKSNSTDDGSNSGTLKRQHSYKSNRTSVDSLNNRTMEICCTSPTFERSPSGHSFNSINNNMSDSMISLPPPPPPQVTRQESHEDISSTSSLPPPPPEFYNSTTSLDSFPLPPNPCELPPLEDGDITGSQLSLMSLPPLPPDMQTDTLRRITDSSSNSCTPTNDISPLNSPTLSTDSFSSSNGIVVTNNIHDKSSGLKSPPLYVNPPAYKNFNGGVLRSSLRHSNSSHEPIYVRKSVTSPPKTSKKISFNLTPQEVPALPRKPAPPRRSEHTKLSSPKKLADPPIDFLKEIQRVMKKKWQVAQKCKEEPNTSPHEVLGFRDPPAILPDYKETNVSNWVQEHYGPNNFYENIYRDTQEVAEYGCSPLHSGKGNQRRPPPPPPPKRSETTHLSTTKTH